MQNIITFFYRSSTQTKYYAFEIKINKTEELKMYEYINMQQDLHSELLAQSPL